LTLHLLLPPVATASPWPIVQMANDAVVSTPSAALLRERMRLAVTLRRGPPCGTLAGM